MNLTAQLALLCFPLIAIAFFAYLPGVRAILATYIVGWLFLPQAGFVLPDVPDYDKAAAIGIGAILGTVLFQPAKLYSVKFTWHDIAILIFCVIPIATHVSNNRGINAGINSAIVQSFLWGIPYWLGRLNIKTESDVRLTAYAILLGGLAYSLLCWYEIFFSPQLHRKIYGFFQHSFIQHIRYGGYRPIVFMQHGIMVGFWMAITALTCFAIWQCGVIKRFCYCPVPVLFLLLGVTIFFCKSMSGIVALIVGVTCLFLSSKFRTGWILVGIALTPTLYIICRMSGVASIDAVYSVVETIDVDRAKSLRARMLQEMLYVDQALKAPVFGFGDGRFMPRDEGGEKLTRGHDGFWIITTGLNGFTSLVSVLIALATPQLLAARSSKHINQFSRVFLNLFAVALGLFGIDLLFNTMINPIYLFIAGGVTSFCDTISHQR